ncbi:MAG TPA: hypothetical protein VGT08_02430 [Terracidiphilus sp.]|nr:hypothetical protein [Terracidiphilus sp.]
MKSLFGGKSALCLAAALVLIACVPVCQARSGSKVDKHAQKIEKKLAHYKAGTLLHLEFNNNTECTGTMDKLSDTSFTFNNAETNAKETHQYSDVSTVDKGKEYIGKGSAPKHHIHIF